MLVVLFISLLAGMGLGMLAWYGWGLFENVNAVRRHRAVLAALAAQAEGDEDADAENGE